MAGLKDLPAELLTQVFSYAFHPRDLCNLCLTSRTIQVSANRRLYEDVEIALGDQNYRIPAMLFGTGRGMEQIRKITISKNKNHYDDDLAQAYVAFILEAIPARQLTDFTWDVEGYYLDLTTQRLLLSKQTQLRYLRKNCSAPDFNAILDERPSILSNLTSLQHVHIEIEEWGDYAIGHHMLKSSDNLKELTISMLKVLENDVYVTSQKAMQLLLNPSPDECAISLPVLEHLQLTGFDLLQTTASWTKLVDFHALKFFNLWDCEQIDTMLERVRRLFICQDVSTTPITKALSAICTQSVEPPRLRELWISRDQSTEQCQQLKFIDGLLLSFSGLTSLFIELRYTGGELSGQQINHLAITNHGYTLRTLCIGIQKSDDALGFDLRQTGLYFSKEEFFHLCLACRHLRHLSLPLYSIDNEDPHEFAKLVDKTIKGLKQLPSLSSFSFTRHSKSCGDDLGAKFFPRMAQAIFQKLWPTFCPQLISISFARTGKAGDRIFHYMRASMTDVSGRIDIVAKDTDAEDVKYVDPSYNDVLLFNTW